MWFWLGTRALQGSTLLPAACINDLPGYVHCVISVQIRSFFWSVFSRIRTEYGEILRISPYSVRMQENTDQKKLRIWTLFTQWLFLILLPLLKILLSTLHMLELLIFRSSLNSPKYLNLIFKTLD